jgi:translation initiation factor 1
MRKLVATMAVVCGLGLVVLPFALSLFDRAPAGERVTNRFRSALSANGLHDLAVNFGTMGAMVDQFIDQTSPQLAHELHMTNSQYDAFVGRQFPAVAAGVKGIPPLMAFVTPVAAQLEELNPQFKSVDSLPFLGLPLTTVSWILVAIGAALIGLGGVIWRTRSRVPVMFAAVLGLAMIVLPLALSYPRKASDATKVAAVGKVALSPQAAAGAQTANRLIDSTVTQVKTEMIPALAQRLHVSTAAFEHSLATNYPAVAKGPDRVAVDQARRGRTCAPPSRQRQRRDRVEWSRFHAAAVVHPGPGNRLAAHRRHCPNPQNSPEASMDGRTRIGEHARAALVSAVVAREPVPSKAVKRDSRVVYSTTDGDLRKARDPKLKERRADGNRVKVRREVAGRRGKAVTTVSGVPVDDVELKELAGKLKKRCGVGGSVRGGVIEIQGDHRDVVVEILKAEGYTPVLAGG